MKQTVDAWRQLEKQQTTWHLANEQADLSTRTGDMLSKKKQSASTLTDSPERAPDVVNISSHLSPLGAKQLSLTSANRMTSTSVGKAHSKK
ncbi:hypothetical protein T11_17208 [Trichinella zimbabwensis]|uniref:Uncharacterized protein n=1 Tax=Trichinella zimbabwensis TaxID=268475 RepID=A0A0V1HHZ7_9BILA|nr:hypothetical protein T11_17208 [Trichinella zimbabwensis]